MVLRGGLSRNDFSQRTTCFRLLRRANPTDYFLRTRKIFSTNDGIPSSERPASRSAKGGE